ncbi:MAG: class I SAM-dependent methyltransferase [Dehalococcoidia bacterium]|nr:class I SAM-dependent methyltransferase [Dehalococcoidia bacterium]
MSFSEKLVGFYFDRVYNPVYDLTTARFSAYRRLQNRSAGKFEFKDRDRLLCVGIGTGSEIPYILSRNGDVDIVGVDMSGRALKRAYQKGLEMGREVELFNMDARNLEFPEESFDKVLCLHVMDFIEDDEVATGGILRVLKKGGQFVITYPMNREGVKLGANMLKDGFHYNMASGKYRRAFVELLAQVGVGIVYFPLLFRKKQRFYSKKDLDNMFAKLSLMDFQVEEDNVYLDFIVYGRK